MDVADSSDVSGLTRMHLICELLFVKKDKKLSQLYLQKPNAILNANGSLPTCLLVFGNPCLMWQKPLAQDLLITRAAVVHRPLDISVRTKAMKQLSRSLFNRQFDKRKCVRQLKVSCLGKVNDNDDVGLYCQGLSHHLSVCFQCQPLSLL